MFKQTETNMEQNFSRTNSAYRTVLCEIGATFGFWNFCTSDNPFHKRPGFYMSVVFAWYKLKAYKLIL